MFGTKQTGNNNLSEHQLRQFMPLPDLGGEGEPGLDEDSRPLVNPVKKKRFGKGFAKGPGAADQWGNSAKFEG